MIDSNTNAISSVFRTGCGHGQHKKFFSAQTLPLHVISTFFVLLISAALPRAALAQVETDEEAPVELSPFEVSSSADVGYQATSSLAGTRINSKLRDLGASISVLTKEFIEDVDATSLGDLLVYATGVEAGGAYGNFTNSSFNRQRADQQGNRTNPEGNTRVRGLVSAEVSRDFYITDFGFDSYNIERVDISRGPNSILFGVGSPGGVVNYSIKRPSLYDDRRVFSLRIGERGTHRERVDVNQVIVPKRLAVRINLLNDTENFRQEPAYENDRRFHGVVEGVLSEGRDGGVLGMTRMRADVEIARVETTPPSVIAPIDTIRDWYLVPDVAAIEAQTGQKAPARYTDGTFVPQALHDEFGTGGPFLGSLSQNLPWFIAIGHVYSDPTRPPLIGFSDPANADLQGAEGRIVGVFDWRQQNSLVEEPWTSGFTASTFQNREIYDFQNQLITGRTEQRIDDFENATVTLEQLFLDDKAGIELSYNKQSLARRTEFPFSDFRSYDVRVDNNLWLGNQEPNPNVGRPFIVSRAWGNHSVAEIDRSTARATGFYDLDLRDASGIGKWVGRHVFSGILERATRETLNRSWAMATSSDEIDMEIALNSLLNGARRQFHGGFYVGPDLRGVGNYGDVRMNGFIDVPTPKNGETFRTFVRDPDTRQIRNVTAFPEEFLDGGSARKRVIDTRAIAWQSYLLDEHIVGLVGYRHDRVRDTLNLSGSRLDDGSFDPSLLALQDDPSLDASGNTTTWSIVGHFPEKYLFELPFGADLSVFLAGSENFQPTGFRQDVFLNPIAPPSGETTEHGFALSFLENRYNLRVNWFETSNNNISLDTNLASGATGAIRGWVNRQVEARRTEVPFGFDVNGRETGIAAYYSSYEEIIQTLIDMVPEPLKSAKNLRVEGAGVGIDNILEDPVQGLASTSSFVAKGVEIEFVANPTDHWTMALNVAKQETVQSGSGVELQDYYSRIRQSLVDANLWDTNVADEPNVQGDITFKQRFSRDWLNPLAAITAKDGTVSQEQRKWRWNFMTSYRFDSGGPLSGFTVGGAARWQDKAAVGYPIILLESEGDVLQTPDLANPYFAPSTWNGDLFLRYQRKISEKLTWTIQANLRNFLGDQDLMPEVINPDGQWAVLRIPVEKAFFLTNTFEF